eukprot:CAMPEP_0194376026 /NCGR_PEP_ID=MMETSP0174-20130528/24548_1 /TAXON_ID=216777 /ORGANISM="Proboscia alata, Strain PI-D3" /LENGTH=584 /DNA_ID=CAMNT_0039156561 /DNA_START=375 /DNA_END=2129 /DNA_ORIENTATION=+
MSAYAKLGAKAAGTILAGGTGVGGYLYATDDGMKRSFQAYSTFAPVILHYRMTELKNKYISSVSEEEWEALDETYAKRTVEKLGRLQGMYSKYGQTAAGLTNTLGDAWIRELRTLENEIPPRPLSVVRKTIEEETPGRRLEDTFSSFDAKPLGSASIGQVHRATLRSTGQEVAVKVQYPEAQELFTKDIHAIRFLCEKFAPEQVCTLEALEGQNKAELDYTNEAQNLLEIGTNMAKHGFQPKECLVPKPFGELSTKRMLVMELLPGPKLIDGMRAFYAAYAKKQGTTLKRMETVARKKFEEEGIPDKYDGPSAAQIASYQRMMKLRDGLVNTFVIGGYNVLVAPVVRLFAKNHNNSKDNTSTTTSTTSKAEATGKIEYLRTTIPPNTPRIVDSLMRIHGYQLLVDGLFNADPHGGNFLLLPDGRIGLIDYGATKRLSTNERISACVMFVALQRKDKDKLWQMATMAGYKSKYMNPDVYYKLVQFGYDTWGKEVTGGMNVQQFMDDLKAKDPYYETPDNFVLASFMSVRLRALTLGMNHPVKCSEYWGEIAEAELNRLGLPYESWDEAQLTKYQPELNIQKSDFY